MELKTVLLFAHECAPYHHAERTIGAQRPAQFAEHLPEFGWRAIDVSVGEHAPDGGLFPYWVSN